MPGMHSWEPTDVERERDEKDKRIAELERKLDEAQEDLRARMKFIGMLSWELDLPKGSHSGEPDYFQAIRGLRRKQLKDAQRERDELKTEVEKWKTKYYQATERERANAAWARSAVRERDEAQEVIDAAKKVCGGFMKPAGGNLAEAIRIISHRCAASEGFAGRENNANLLDLKKGLEKAEHNCRVWEQLATERRDACLAAEQQADKYRKWHEDQLAATKKAERERDEAITAADDAETQLGMIGLKLQPEGGLQYKDICSKIGKLQAVVKRLQAFAEHTADSSNPFCQRCRYEARKALGLECHGQEGDEC